ncbi:MAG: hypothetical protein WKH64_03275 [Chloroflexia bacterium]
MFLMWFDDTKKKPVEEKILEGIERYVQRFGAAPDVCLVNPSEVVQAQGIAVRATHYVRPNHYWFGVEQPEPARAAPARRSKRAA